MIEERGRVAEVAEGFAWVEIERKSSCGSCSAKGCGTGTLAKAFSGRRQRIRVGNGPGAAPGDEVIIGLREEALLSGSFAVYIVPLVAMLAGAMFGETLAGQLAADAERLSLITGGAGFGLGLLWLRAFSRRAANDGRYQAELLRVVRQNGVATVAVDRIVQR